MTLNPCIAAGALALAASAGMAATAPRETDELLARINAYRAAGARCGSQAMAAVRPLAWDAALERAAAVQAQHLARIDDVTHTGADGSNVSQRVSAQGYEWGHVGENVAAGKDSAAATLAQWMASPGHCRNLMGPQFERVAVAWHHSPGTTYKHYWVMVLAAPLR